MNAIEMAIRMEQEAVEFYTKCAERTDNPVGRKMFLSIAEDEQYHVECAVNMQKGHTVVPSSSTPLEDMKKIFEQHKNEMLAKIPSTASELDALKVAMKMEEKSIDFYRSAYAQAATEKEKNFFECLIKDEEEHFRIFQNTYTFLDDSGNWFMWEEKGIIEG